MRIALLIWGLLIWQIAAWTFAPPRPSAEPPKGDGKAYDNDEKYMVEGRDKQRRTALSALDMPWAAWCGDQGHKQLVSRLSEYYYHRQNQTERYLEIHGQLGANYIAQQWATADDQRIDRLTAQAYRNGYVEPTQFSETPRKLIQVVIRNERVVGKGCAGN